MPTATKTPGSILPPTDTIGRGPAGYAGDWERWVDPSLGRWGELVAADGVARLNFALYAGPMTVHEAVLAWTEDRKVGYNSGPLAVLAEVIGLPRADQIGGEAAA